MECFLSSLISLFSLYFFSIFIINCSRLLLMIRHSFIMNPSYCCDQYHRKKRNTKCRNSQWTSSMSPLDYTWFYKSFAGLLAVWLSEAALVPQASISSTEVGQQASMCGLSSSWELLFCVLLLHYWISRLPWAWTWIQLKATCRFDESIYRSGMLGRKGPLYERIR